MAVATCFVQEKSLVLWDGCESPHALTVMAIKQSELHHM